MALFRRGRVWWMGFSYQGRQVRRSTEVTDKKLAEKIYHKVMVQIAEGKWYPPEAGADKTVKELLERYLTDHSAPNNGEREDARCTESQGKSPIAQDGLCLLQRGWKPDGCAGPPARVLSRDEESRRDTLSIS